MINTDPVAAYTKLVADLQQRMPRDEAMHQAVGGNFIAVGKLEHHLLRSLGLSDGHFVIDIGCGSGRLAYQLAPFNEIRYLGTDVVSDLLEYARERCAREDFKFKLTQGTVIPVDDEVADFVCFFSVFTHLLHEDSFKYCREAARVLKPGGRLVMSFLEFKVPMHWEIFMGSVDHAQLGQHLNQFVERDAIYAWAKHAGFRVERIYGGGTLHIPIPEPIEFEDGTRWEQLAAFGRQSVAVWVKDSPSEEISPIPSDTPDLGWDLNAGDDHYRAYVGPPRDYDLIAAMTFNLLTSAGLRQHHRVLDIGCGSLRIGRLLIPYLNPKGYIGVEPNSWLVQAGIEREIGQDLVNIKCPTFIFSDSLTALSPSLTVDYVVAQSIFSHCGKDLLEQWLSQIAFYLKEDGVLFATFLIDDQDFAGEGWVYPSCVKYRPETIAQIAAQAGLTFEILNWLHPRQTWAAFAKPNYDRSLIENGHVSWNHFMSQRLGIKNDSSQ